jgi:hypothetical protein
MLATAAAEVPVLAVVLALLQAAMARTMIAAAAVRMAERAG